MGADDHFSAEEPPRVDKKELKRASISGAIFNAVSSLGKAAVGMTTLVVFSRLISPESYGVFAIASVVLAIGELARDFGLGTAALVEKTLSPEQRSNLFWLNLGMGVVVALIVMAATPLISTAMGMPALLAVLPVCGFIFVVNGASSQFAVTLRRRYRFSYVARVDILGLLVSFSVAFTLALAGAQYWALVVQSLVGNAISSVGVVLGARWRPQRYRRDVPMRHMVTQGLHFLGNATIAVVSANLGTVLIGRSLGASEVGIYNRANQLVRVPTMQLMNPIASVVQPSLARLQDDALGFAGYVRKAQVLISYPSGVVAATLAGLAPWAVPFILGARWSGAASVVTVLAVGTVIQAANQAPTWVLWAQGYAKELARLSLVNSLITLTCVVVGGMQGSVGVAWGYAVAGLTTWPISLVTTQRISGFHVWPATAVGLRMIAVSALSGAAAALVATAIPGGNLVRLLIGGAASLALFGSCAMLVPAVRRDVQVGIDILRRR